jgi:hypothetical protein
VTQPKLLRLIQKSGLADTYPLSINAQRVASVNYEGPLGECGVLLSCGRYYIVEGSVAEVSDKLDEALNGAPPNGTPGAASSNES